MKSNSQKQEELNQFLQSLIDELINKYNITDIFNLIEIQQKLVQEPPPICINRKIVPIKDNYIYGLYRQHNHLNWGPDELDISSDQESFDSLSKEWQNVLLWIFSILAFGDNIVSNELDRSIIDEWFEAESLLFFKDQNAREAVHEIVYRKMLLLGGHRFDEFNEKKFGSDLCFPQMKNNNGQRSLFLLNIIFCERIYFAVPFFIILIMGRCGYISTIDALNRFVMRDENLHYLHALALFKKYNTNEENDTLIEFAKNFLKITKQNNELFIPSQYKPLMDLFVDQIMIKVLLDCGLILINSQLGTDLINHDFGYSIMESDDEKINGMEAIGGYNAVHENASLDWNIIVDNL